MQFITSEFFVFFFLYDASIKICKLYRWSFEITIFSIPALLINNWRYISEAVEISWRGINKM